MVVGFMEMSQLGVMVVVVLEVVQAVVVDMLV